MELYKQAYKAAEAETEVERSRFIAHVFPAETKEEADSYLAGIKAEYRDADHNVPAMVIGDRMQLQWASDDGEPQGTSCAPVLMKMVKEGVTNTLIVVTRYFGGIKLGTGGLVRAYTGAAGAGLKAAGICSVREMIRLKMRFDYRYLSRIESMAAKLSFTVADTVYDDGVTMDIIFAPEKGDEIIDSVKGITAGRIKIISEEKSAEKLLLTY